MAGDLPGPTMSGRVNVQRLAVLRGIASGESLHHSPRLGVANTWQPWFCIVTRMMPPELIPVFQFLPSAAAFSGPVSSSHQPVF
jgi:hypothetical protein